MPATTRLLLLWRITADQLVDRLEPTLISVVFVTMRQM